jgi:hypothetical protein
MMSRARWERVVLINCYVVGGGLNFLSFKVEVDTGDAESALLVEAKIHYRIWSKARQFTSATNTATERIINLRNSGFGESSTR